MMSFKGKTLSLLLAFLTQPAFLYGGEDSTGLSPAAYLTPLLLPMASLLSTPEETSSYEVQGINGPETYVFQNPSDEERERELNTILDRTEVLQKESNSKLSKPIKQEGDESIEDIENAIESITNELAPLHAKIIDASKANLKLSEEFISKFWSLARELILRKKQLLAFYSGTKKAEIIAEIKTYLILEGQEKATEFLSKHFALTNDELDTPAIAPLTSMFVMTLGDLLKENNSDAYASFIWLVNFFKNRPQRQNVIMDKYNQNSGDIRDHLKKVLEAVKSNKHIYNAVVLYFHIRMQTLYPFGPHTNNHPLLNFISWLYRLNPDSVEIKFMYIKFVCIGIPRNLDERLSILEILVSNKRFNTGEINFELAQTLFKLDRKEESLKYLEKAVDFEPNNLKFLKLLFSVSFMLGEYEKTVETSKRIMQEIDKNKRSEIKSIQFYTLLSHIFLGDNVNSVELLQKTFENKKNSEKKLKFNKERTQRIKNYLALSEMERSNISNKKQNPRPSQQERKITTIDSPEIHSAFTNSSITNLKSTYRNQASPIKRKRRGQAQTQIQTPPVHSSPILIMEAEMQDNTPRETLENLLIGKPKSAYNTFCRLFKSITGFYDPKISMSEIQSLFENLGQEFSRQKGHGSHSKITTSHDFANSGKNGEMIILANEKFLTKAQINNLVSVFLGYNLYPADMEALLRQKMLID